MARNVEGPIDYATYGGQAQRTVQTNPGVMNQAPQYATQQGSDQQAQQRYQQMGAAGATQNSWDLPTRDARTQENQTRGSQMGALNLQQQAAMGNAPSAAQNMAQSQIDNGINSQMAMAASARGGPLAVASAQRQAAMQGAMSQQQGVAQIGALRAQEMSDARGQYMQGASGIRGQDLQNTQMMGNFGMQQQGLNNQNQLGYEQLGYNVGNSNLNAQLQAHQLQQQQQQFNDGQSQHQEDHGWDLVGGVISGVAGAVTHSDVRVKHDVVPLREQPMGVGPSWMSPYGGGQ